MIIIEVFFVCFTVIKPEASKLARIIARSLKPKDIKCFGLFLLSLESLKYGIRVKAKRGRNIKSKRGLSKLIPTIIHPPF